MSFRDRGGPSIRMQAARCAPLAHLELHTGDLPGARAFYTQLCGWRPERIETAAGSYLGLEWGGQIDGGIVQSPTERAVWLPYVEVAEIGALTDRARRLGATIVLDSREGPAGWRSVIATPAGGELALWQPKR